MPKLRSHSARERHHDNPSTSKQPDIQTEDRSQTKTPEKPDRDAKTPEPERPESPPNCSICLSIIENKAFTDSCFHTFCYVCLLEWSKVKAVCPLCKQPFKKIIYNVRSLDDFDEYVIPPPHSTRDHLWENQNYFNHLWAVNAGHARFRYRTTLADRVDHAYLSRRRHPAGHYGRNLLGPSTRRISREEARERRATQARRNRRRIYDHDMWVLPVSPTSEPTEMADYDSRYRETSPEFFAANEACRYQLIPWLSRELNVLLHDHDDNVHFVLELILDLIQRFEIRSDEFYELVRPFLHRHTRHFVHEFYHFARSPYDVMTYDQRVTYESRPNGALASADNARGGREESDDSDDDDVMVMEEESSNPPETLNEMLSRTSGVPVVNIGPINVEWNLPNTLDTVRTFLQNVGVRDSGLGAPESGASQMARIHSHHAAGSQTTTPPETRSDSNDVIDLSRSTEAEVAVTLADSESEDDVIFVKYEKPYADRTPIIVSSCSDDEVVIREDRALIGERRRSRRESGSRRRRSNRDSVSGGSRARDHRSRSRDRRSKSRYHGSRSRRSRSRDGRSRSSFRSPRRDRDRRSRSRELYRSSSRDGTLFCGVSREARFSKSHDHKRDRRRSRSRSLEGRRSSSLDRLNRHRRWTRSMSRDRWRSRSSDRPSRSRRRRRYSSSDSVEITKVKRKKRAKKHKNKHRKKHKKHHKKRRLSCSDDRETSSARMELPASSESRKYKKHPTGHKSSKAKPSCMESELPTHSAVSDIHLSEIQGLLASSGFESGDASSDLPAIPLPTKGNSSSAVDDVVIDADDHVDVSCGAAADDVVDPPGTVVADLLNDILDKVARSVNSERSTSAHSSHGKQIAQVHRDLVVKSASIESLSSVECLAENSLEEKVSGSVSIGEIAEKSRMLMEEFMPEEIVNDDQQESKSSLDGGHHRPNNVNEICVDSEDSDCIVDEDDDVLFECECRCRARQKCAKCLKSDTSSSSSDSLSDSDISVQGGSSTNDSAAGLRFMEKIVRNDSHLRTSNSNFLSSYPDDKLSSPNNRPSCSMDGPSCSNTRPSCSKEGLSYSNYDPSCSNYGPSSSSHGLSFSGNTSCSIEPSRNELSNQEYSLVSQETDVELARCRNESPVSVRKSSCDIDSDDSSTETIIDVGTERDDRMSVDLHTGTHSAGEDNTDSDSSDESTHSPIDVENLSDSADTENEEDVVERLVVESEDDVEESKEEIDVESSDTDSDSVVMKENVRSKSPVTTRIDLDDSDCEVTSVVGAPTSCRYSAVSSHSATPTFTDLIDMVIPELSVGDDVSALAVSSSPRPLSLTPPSPPSTPSPSSPCNQPDRPIPESPPRHPGLFPTGHEQSPESPNFLIDVENIERDSDSDSSNT